MAAMTIRVEERLSRDRDFSDRQSPQVVSRQETGLALASRCVWHDRQKPVARPGGLRVREMSRDSVRW
jgi:hypothetical protein